MIKVVLLHLGGLLQFRHILARKTMNMTGCQHPVECRRYVLSDLAKVTFVHWVIFSSQCEQPGECSILTATLSDLF
jgi:hypothetical protein